MNYFIGIDIGTTNVKGIALTTEGDLLAHESVANETLQPYSDRQEQDPEQIFQHILTIIKQVQATCSDKGNLQGVSFSSGMHSVIALDKDKKTLTNALLWSDLRANNIVETLKNSPNFWETITQCGTPAHPMSPLFKIRWMKDEQPEVFGKTQYFAGLKSYMWHRFFGKLVMDVSEASATGLMDSQSSLWHKNALDMAGISAENLPEIVSPYHVENLGADWSKELGLPLGTPFVMGASDGTLANLGLGAKDGMAMVITIGTSAALRVNAPRNYRHGDTKTFCYRLDEDNFILGGASNNGGNVLGWLKNKVFEDHRPMSDFLATAENAPTDCEGLLFLPHIHGERAPLWDAEAAGCFFGVKNYHKKAHFIRASMLGVLLNLKVIAESIPIASKSEKILVSGGFSESQFWLSLLADVFQLPVSLPASQGADASAIGAVMMGRNALGLPPMLEEQTALTVFPDRNNENIYQEMYKKYKDAINKA